MSSEPTHRPAATDEGLRGDIECPVCGGGGRLVDVTAAVEEALDRGHQLRAITPLGDELDAEDAPFAVMLRPPSTPTPPTEHQTMSSELTAHRRIVDVIRKAKSAGNLVFPYPGKTEDLDEGKLASDLLATLDAARAGEGLDVERLVGAMERAMAAVDDEWTIPEFAELTAAEYATIGARGDGLGASIANSVHDALLRTGNHVSAACQVAGDTIRARLDGNTEGDSE